MSITHNPTTSQTAGPFFSLGLLDEIGTRQVLIQPETTGERIRIEGQVFDGDGLPVPDALVEIWQANAAGRYHHPTDQSASPLDPTFLGFGRSGTDEQGWYWFETIKPGPVPLTHDAGQMQAPHICVTICARGLLNHLSTRLYFADEPANAQDVVLHCVPAERRATLLARLLDEDQRVIYHFDIVLQGQNETAFFQL
jgi:protocatechuate 3,4-dioxygenase alpha subunit